MVADHWIQMLQVNHIKLRSLLGKQVRKKTYVRDPDTGDIFESETNEIIFIVSGKCSAINPINCPSQGSIFNVGAVFVKRVPGYS